MANCADEQARCRIGDRVRIRRERWLVAGVEGTSMCRLLTLAGLGPHNVREQRLLLEPFEDIEPIATPATGPGGEPRQPFTPPSPVWRCGRRRWRAGCRSAIVDSGPWEALHAADAARIEVLPYQLEPARAVVRGDGTRVLLADAVGLGKTVQAGLLLAELLRRGAVESALILAPAGLREQWQQELRERFALDSEVCDLRTAAQRLAGLPVGVSPWATLRTAIASVDYAKRPEVLPAIRARLWDLVIVDEAHGMTPGTERYDAVSALCATALYVVLLTATPHSGDRDAYTALCALGGRDDVCLRFRRSRADVDLQTARRAHQLRIRPSAGERRLHTALEHYAAAVRAECGAERSAALLLSILWKRALSSPEACRRSVVRRLAALDRGAPFDEAQLRLPLDDGHGEFDVSDEAPALDGPVLSDVGRERRLLERLSRAAADACSSETKLSRLGRLLARLKRRSEAVIVFTEYRDTLIHVQHTVAPDALVLHGGLTRGERRAAIDAFTNGVAPTLLATDAAGEGLNLHHACRCVVHLELPWNPVRLEQRTGRVDRIGQRRTVHAFHLVSRHRAEDDLLRRLQARVAAARQDVDMASPLESQRPSPGPAGPQRTAAVGSAWSRPPDAGTADEVARIARVRGLARRYGRADQADRDAAPGGGHGGDRLLVVRARSRLRARLRGDTLLIAEVVAVDALGRRIAATVVPLRLARPRHDGGVPARLAARRAIAAVVERRCGSLNWHAAHEAFWTAAHRRGEAIALAAMPEGGVLFQPGLFDRRADCLHQTLAIERQSLADAATHRAARLAAARGDVSMMAGCWLALVP